MKTTKLMCLCILTFFATWIVLGVIAWSLSDYISFRHCMSHGSVILMLMAFGWVPSVIVGIDYYESNL